MMAPLNRTVTIVEDIATIEVALRTARRVHGRLQDLVLTGIEMSAIDAYS